MFDNAFLELLYAHDIEELHSEAVDPLGLGERIHWQETGACPFGICFRPAADSSVPGSWPFATWGYKAEYLPPDVTMLIVTPARSFTEPLLFLSNQPAKVAPPGANRDLSHGPSLRTITGVKVSRPSGLSAPSQSVSWFRDNGLILLQDDSEYLLELEFDDGRERKAHRFPQGLPLVVRW